MKMPAYLQLIIPDRTESMGNKLVWHQLTPSSLHFVRYVMWCSRPRKSHGTRWHKPWPMPNEYNIVLLSVLALF